MKPKKINRHKRLGYRDYIEINGKSIQLGNACKRHPVEVFKLIDKKQIIVGERIYQNMLDVIKKIDFNLYKTHRIQYHLRQQERISKRDQYELDYIVRNNLKNDKNIGTINICLKEKRNPKFYSRISNTDEIINHNYLSNYKVTRSKWNDYTKRFKVRKID
ncbi:MAG: hypothetical protein ACON5K_01340 [Bacteroidia bacterium]